MKTPSWPHSNLFKSWKLNTISFKTKQNKKSQFYDLSHKLLYFHAKNQLNFPSVHELFLKKTLDRQMDGWHFIGRDYSKQCEPLQFWYMGLSPCKLVIFAQKIIFMSVIDDNTHSSGSQIADRGIAFRYGG